MQRTFQQVYVVPGTLAGNHIYLFKAPFDLQLVHASLVNTSANAGTLKIGDASDDDCYLAAENFGVSSSPAEVASYSGFDGVSAAGQYPHILDGGVVKITITDHASHMADACVVLTFTEG